MRHADNSAPITRFLAPLAAFSLLICAAPQARAQMSNLVNTSGETPISKSLPVTFQADQVGYDKTANLVTATGHVEAFQNGHTLYADQVTIDRKTNIATATGHVILIEPSGQVLYANHAKLTDGMKNAILDQMSSRLAENGRLIANGARRYGGQINELAKVVYSACDLCKTDPTAPPIWQIRARSAVQDLQHKIIEYHDAELEIYGFPIVYLPYFSQPDPSVKRQSGLLIPAAGNSTHIGFFAAVPYFYVIDKSSDVTIEPIIASRSGPVLEVKYRKAFNDGQLHIDVSGGQDQGEFQNAIFSTGVFDINSNWRAGFTYDRTSSTTYLNDFRVLPNSAFLASNAYIEGFAPGAYARVDAQFFQGLVATISQNQLPIVLPHAQYDYFGAPDQFGGRFSFNADAFNVIRTVGTNTRRAAFTGNYELPLNGPDGTLWTLRGRVITAAYEATHLYQQPNFTPIDSAGTGRAMAYAALAMRWPFIRSAGAYGTQIIEPRLQLVAAPNVGSSQNIRLPNEDSLDLEFTDANLFSLNRFPGIDRIEGGERADVGLHAAWYLPSGAWMDGLIGQSYRAHKDNVYPVGSGLSDHISDIVARATVAPVKWLNFSYRTRLDHRDLGARLIDTTATIGGHALSFTGGYLYSSTNPYFLYDQAGPPPASYYVARHEITAGISTNFGAWSLSAATQRNLTTGAFDNAAASATWQNECTAFNLTFYRRFTSFNLDHGGTTLLFQITLKTLGNIGFSTL